ncbi:MAG: bacteriohemerythrin [Magnetococcales bacterium]|nr:bacteriohemerythrin [Magnetococcales bacterium]
MADQEIIKKISVARGLFWVEFPDADLRVLCGCPMDCVKHLMKRGLITQTEREGVPFETGPNAILLSDVMLQNGEFSNLGEFPVLQMLYKQGLILPNHPNNTGQKPLLIGLGEQINAQMQYIYRGNYGLVSKEEIMMTGEGRKRAEEMMRIKLRFAFGTIRPSQDLLDTCTVKDKDVEIRNGVIIRRKSLNIYEFEFQGKRVIVDLNLNEGETYEAAYPLSFQFIPREYFGVIHSGEGDGWDVNRPSMSSIIMFQGKIYLIDAGPNLFNNLSALGIGINEIEGVFHTHAHDDHFCGITTLMRSGHKIKYFATPPVRATVEKKIAALLSIEEERFQDFFEIHNLKADVWNDVQGLEVQPIYSPHPLETTVFLFRTLWEEGYKSYAHFADIVSLKVLEEMIEPDPSKPGVSQAYFDEIKTKYLTPVNLKKLDIGGGMIHGTAVDFKQDKSERILLAHLARELTYAEKEIGSNAPHGMVDVLISSQSDLARRNAFSFIESALPNIPFHHLRILINAPVVDFNPGTILLKEGEKPTVIYLILTGAVEKIRTSENHFSRLSGGTLVGDLPGLYDIPSEFTYSTACFVKALEMPIVLFRELIKRNNLMGKIEQTWEDRTFLESTNLFSEGVYYRVFNQIIDEIKVQTFQAGEVIACRDLTYLNLIKSGRITRSLRGKRLDILEPKDYFGEESAIFNTTCLFRLEALDPVTTYQIPGKLVGDIPIVRWKLYESYLKRASEAVHLGGERDSLRWSSTYSIQILEMDTHHKKLLEIARGVLEVLRTENSKGTLKNALNTLIKYTEHHFSVEQNLMQRYAYPDFRSHRETHKKLMGHMNSFQKKAEKKRAISQEEFKTFFHDLFIEHFITDDRNYAQFLNAKGIY